MYHDKHQAPPADNERRAPRLLAAFQTLWVAAERQIVNRRPNVTKLLHDITGFYFVATGTLGSVLVSSVE